MTTILSRSELADLIDCAVQCSGESIAVGLRKGQVLLADESNWDEAPGFADRHANRKVTYFSIDGTETREDSGLSIPLWDTTRPETWPEEIYTLACDLTWVALSSISPLEALAREGEEDE